jgi:hypothetical protein
VPKFPGRTHSPQATIAYLILPGSVKRQYSWSERECGRDVHGKCFKTASVGENGFGMPVEMRGPLSAKQLDQFPRAMEYLNLKVFIHESQTQYPALSTSASNSDAPEKPKDSESFEGLREVDGALQDQGSSKSHDLYTVKISISPFPRLTLLTRIAS